MNKTAAKFFHNCLMAPEGKEALDYLLKRKFSPALIKRFGMGYAPNSFNALTDHLKAKGFNEKEKHIMGTQLKKINTFTNNGSYKVFSYDNITSREMSEPLYARVYTKKDNVYKYGRIHKYNVKDYAVKQIEKNEDAALIKLLRCLLIYGEEAEKFFSSKNL